MRRTRATPAAAAAPRPGADAPLLRIVVIAPDQLDPDDADLQREARRSTLLREGLVAGGYDIVATVRADVRLAETLALLKPDLIIVDAESQARDALEHVVAATRDARRPIVMFTEDEDTSMVPDAIRQGVTAYVVAGLAAARVRPVLDVAMARFQHEEGLRRELADARDQLEDRKAVERAKGLLMKRHGWTEDQAYASLRKLAMDRGLKLAELARRVVDAAQLLG